MNELFWISVIYFLVIPIAGFTIYNAKSKPWLWLSIAVGNLAQVVFGFLAIARGGAVFLGQMPGVKPFGTWEFAVDPLAGWLFIILGVIGIASTVYASGKKNHAPGTGVFILSIVSIQFVFTSFLLVAQNALPFLIAWEGMSLCAYAFILTDHRARRVRHAAFVTLTISELGFLALVIAFIAAAASSGSLDFTQIHLALLHDPISYRTIVFALALLGFGTKSGVLPVQMWMPRAYSVTPPHLNAMLAGGLLNLGLFGILKMYSLSGPLPVGWGIFILLLGACAVFLGALYAAIATNLRMILAFSSIENVGFMLISLGLAIAFARTNAYVFAGVAMSAFILQMTSHALAKALSFLAVGEVMQFSRSENLDDLGGLFHTAPGVAVALLIGSLSLAAVAPFSGFTAEWLTLQTMLQAYRSFSPIEQFLVVLAGALSAIGAAMALTAFLRLFAFIFTGKARNVQYMTRARRPSFAVGIGMGLLAVVSALYGFFPTAALVAIEKVVASMPPYGNLLGKMVPDVFTHPGNNALLVSLGGRMLHFLPMQGAVIQPAAGVSSISATYIVWWFLFFGLLALVLSWLMRRQRNPYGNRVVPAWIGGKSDFSPQAQYSATAFTNPHRMFFATLLRFTVKREVVAGLAMIPTSIRVETHVSPWLQSSIYTSLIRRGRKLLGKIIHIQHGYLWGYVFLMLFVLVVLLLWAQIS